MNQPLGGFTLLDVGTMTPGKYCSHLLAELGADVIRIERPAGYDRPLDDEDLVLNQGKRSVTLNLRSDAGRDIFLRLAERADVILESNRPGAADRNGFGYEAVRHRQPGIVYCALSGYGATGPQSQAPGYDLIFMAQSGMLRALTGANVPAVPRAYLADGVAGLTAALAIVVALLGREREGGGAGCFLDLAMQDALFAQLAVSTGPIPPDARPADAPDSPTYQVYEAAGGTWLALGAIRPSSVLALFESLGRVDLAHGEAAEVRSFLTETFASKTAREWVAQLAPLDVEIAPVNGPLEAFADPQLRAREMIGQAEHARTGAFEFIRPALTSWRTAGNARPAPRIGEHTEAVLGSLGFQSQDIRQLRAQGVV